MFSSMLLAEKKLFYACQKGEVLSLSDECPSEKTSSNEIRGEFLRYLILSHNQEIEINDNNSFFKIDPLGIMFSGAYISGEFDFSFCETHISFKFVNSTFKKAINLSASKIKFLNLNGSFIPSINARALVCMLDIYLGEKFESNGNVDFGSALIEGSLKCTNGKFINEVHNALSFDKTIIKGSVFLNNGFDARGKVNFQSAQIGSNLECTNGKFTNGKGYALNCNNTKIQGSVFLNNGFNAKGGVSFNGAQIENNLTCSKGMITNKNNFALYCGDAIIQGNVFLNDEFIAEGNISFISSKISKSLIVSDIHIESICDLRFAKLGVITEIEKFWGKEGFEILDLDGLEYNHLSGENLDSSTLKKWLNKMPEFKPQPYKHLAKVLRNMGHQSEADDIMIEYNNIITKKSDNRFISILRIIYGKTAGYGYKPMRVFNTIFLIWLLCGSFYWAVSQVAVFAPSNPLVFQKKDFYQCNVNPNGTPILSIFDWNDYNSTNNWTANTKLDGEYTTFSSYWYSLDILLPIVDLQMDKDWGQFVPSDGVTLNHITRWIVWLEILSGWIFSLMLVAILSGLAKNEKD